MSVLPLPTPAIATVKQFEEERRRRQQRVPLARNRQIYEQVMFAERSQADVAKEFGVSQQRVGQIIHQMLAWLAENVPEQARCFSPQQQLTLAINEAYLRMQYLQFRAQRAFDASCRDKLTEKVKVAADGTLLWKERSRGSQSGRPGYLGTQIRTTLDSLKIVQMSGGCLDLAMHIMDYGHHEPANASQIDKDFAAEGVFAKEAASHATGPVPVEVAVDTTICGDNSPLWNSADLPLPGVSLTAATCVASRSPDTNCSTSQRRKSFLASANPTLKNPCSSSGREAIAGAEDTAIASADDRRNRRKDRQKQLARWQARRQKVEPVSCA